MNPNDAEYKHLKYPSGEAFERWLARVDANPDEESLLPQATEIGMSAAIQGKPRKNPYPLIVGSNCATSREDWFEPTRPHPTSRFRHHCLADLPAANQEISQAFVDQVRADRQRVSVTKLDSLAFSSAGQVQHASRTQTSQFDHPRPCCGHEDGCGAVAYVSQPGLRAVEDDRLSSQQLPHGRYRLPHGFQSRSGTTDRSSLKMPATLNAEPKPCTRAAIML